MEQGKDDARSLTYSDAGVDIDRQDEALRRIKQLVGSTKTSGVVSDLGSFGGLFQLPTGLKAPLLVASCDGVGTKLKVAFDCGVHNTVGRDLVNHCVNDILVQGARPLFFMDYVASGRLDPGVLEAVVAGIASGCRESGCALLGGEIAEMPGFYSDGEYDVAGFVLGVVDREQLIDGSAIDAGDQLIGLPSAGLHTNGYSLARKVIFEVAGLSADDPIPGLDQTAGKALLAEHRCYLPALRESLDLGLVRGMAHITGGGLLDNVPRILPDGMAAEFDRSAWPVPPLFGYMQKVGGIAQGEMDRTFNMGLGMVVVVHTERLEDFEASLDRAGETHYRVGRIVPGDRSVSYV